MIFIDTNFFMGLFIKTDYWFTRAKELIKEIPVKDRIICPAILNETITLLGMKTDMSTCEIAYNYLRDTCIIFNETEVINYNAKIMKTYLEFNGDLSFTDCTVVESMRQLGIKKIVTFDKDFDKINWIERIH